MNEFEQAEERRKRQREEIKQKRIRQLRRRMTISGCILLCIIIALSAFAVNVAKKKKLAAEQKKQLEQEIAQMNESLNDCYNTFLTDNGVSAEKSDVTAFTKWLEKNYSEEMDDLFSVYQKNKKITAQDIYDSFGATLHVLSDTYEGKLKDEATAAKNHIYEKKAAENGTVQITAAGDLCLEEDGYVLDYYDTVNDLSKCISKSILDQTNAADIFFLNHEYCISDRGTPLEDKYYVFRAKPERMKLLEQMGTDIVSIANNHIYDYGADAMDDTIDLLDQAKITHVGGGTNLDEAKQPTYYIINGIKIGFVAASEGEQYKFTPEATDSTTGILTSYDTTEYNQVIADASKECDYLIAYVHWGTEDEDMYNSTQTEHGKEFLKSGADIVIGGHPHVLQGIETYKGRNIVYSLGNFCFGGNSSPSDMDTMIYQQTFTIDADGVKKDNVTNIIPCSISSAAYDGYNNYQPTPAEGDEATRILGKINERSSWISTAEGSTFTAKYNSNNDSQSSSADTAASDSDIVDMNSSASDDTDTETYDESYDTDNSDAE